MSVLAVAALAQAGLLDYGTSYSAAPVLSHGYAAAPVLSHGYAASPVLSHGYAAAPVYAKAAQQVDYYVSWRKFINCEICENSLPEKLRRSVHKVANFSDWSK